MLHCYRDEMYFMDFRCVTTTTFYFQNAPMYDYINMYINIHIHTLACSTYEYQTITIKKTYKKKLKQKAQQSIKNYNMCLFRSLCVCLCYMCVIYRLHKVYMNMLGIFYLIKYTMCGCGVIPRGFFFENRGWLTVSCMCCIIHVTRILLYFTQTHACFM